MASHAADPEARRTRDDTAPRTCDAGPGRGGSDGERRLQELLGSAGRADRFYTTQVLDHLNDRMRAFVARMQMMFVSTSDRRGNCDCTLRAGPPGFVRVISPRTIGWPEYRGNGVHASVGNIAENPHAGVLFVDFTHDVIGLHVNGAAELAVASRMPSWLTRDGDAAPGRRPELWVLLDVHEAYIHCRKHIPHMVPAPRDWERPWGTDDPVAKGGDYFGVAADQAITRGRHEANGALSLS